VKFFFKQWGGTRKHTTGRLLDGRTYDEFPNRAANAVAADEVRQQRILSIQEGLQFLPVPSIFGG
jgi:hypothetical protein